MLNCNELIGFGVGDGSNPHKFWRISVYNDTSIYSNYAYQLYWLDQLGNNLVYTVGGINRAPIYNGSVYGNAALYDGTPTDGSTIYWMNKPGTSLIDYEFTTPVEVKTVNLLSANTNKTTNIFFSDDNVTWTAAVHTKSSYTYIPGLIMGSHVLQ